MVKSFDSSETDGGETARPQPEDVGAINLQTVMLLACRQKEYAKNSCLKYRNYVFEIFSPVFYRNSESFTYVKTL